MICWVEKFQRVRSLPHYNVPPAWVLQHHAQHQAEHRGELGSVVVLFRTGE